MRIMSAAEKRRHRRKVARINRRAFREAHKARQGASELASGSKSLSEQEDLEPEYVSAPIPGDDDGEDNPIFADFSEIFQKFMKAEELVSADDETDKNGQELERKKGMDSEAGGFIDKENHTSDSDVDGVNEADKLSKKKKKMLSRLKIAELKQSCRMPDVVEVWDVTAQDPRLLVFLKSCRNSVPVPRHWSQKRKFLQGKRGIEKPIFKLPDFIEATGITEMRQAYQEKEDQKKLKQKQRDRMQPKMGKMDIDYQSKPKLSSIGELYYEGKEFEAQTKQCQPGLISSELKSALGMSEDGPPPWLINMQRYGPPPSYPALKVPGLNAPIPSGAAFGYHPGGWGKPPVDEHGNPIYGDVFGILLHTHTFSTNAHMGKHWGALDSDDGSDEEDDESEHDDDDQEGEDTDALADGYRSVDTDISSLPQGLETPDTIQLRKGVESVDSEQPKQLFTVLEQKAAAVGGSIMGSDHTYIIPDKDRRALNPGAQKRLDILGQLAGTGDIEVTLTPEEIEGLDDEAISKLYAQRIQEIKSANKPEDFSGMVAAKAAQQKRKAVAKEQEKAAKKQKDTFKF